MPQDNWPQTEDRRQINGRTDGQMDKQIDNSFCDLWYNSYCFYSTFERLHSAETVIL